MRPDYWVGALWIGGALSYLEQLCLRSFVDAGHRVVLYTYDGVELVPEGVELADANAVLPGEVLRNSRTGSPALHSDLFRYRLLAGGDRIIWADTDAYCLRPMRPVAGHLYGWEGDTYVNGGVLALPPDSATLRALLDFTADPHAIPPWYGPAEQAKLAEAAARGAPVHAADLPWGVWGPDALTHFLRATGEIVHALPQPALYPFRYRERHLMLRPGLDLKVWLTPETLSIHFYGRRMRARLAHQPGGLPKPRSLIGRLLRRHGIDPAAAPLPRPAPGIAVAVDEDDQVPAT